MKKRLLLCIWIMTGVIAGCSSETSHTNKVNIDKVEIVAPNVQGAGWDLTARAMQKTLTEEKIFTKPITVTNKVGGSGDVGWKYTKQKGGHILAINSSLLITNNLLGHSKLTYKDFTPLATLASDWEVVVVSKDSTIDNANELMKQLKQDKKNFKIGVAPGLGNDDHLSFVQVSKEKIINALTNKQIGAATMTLSEAEKQYKAGKIKILAVSAPKRIDRLPQIPTWKEQGIDVIFQHWKGIMGPKDMTEEEVAYWDGVIKRMVESDSWKGVLRERGWNSYYKDSGESRGFLEESSRWYGGMVGGARVDK
ncbi:tripartite tricarboxylate transporter substrate binding protein [Bacillus cereus]|uniref:tripartite tricarboxylate transporter substrate binding protein n=1 Tax=Bacillus cereus TaxID=1396 RepID=UPI001F2BDF52|nr:tripartite tricarboxylate transporter substrate-binding protein [Bacillus cereus]UIJ67283.1 tripartite tricarboxylate transporter substrate binding protein [Bacillus cereus]